MPKKNVVVVMNCQGLELIRYLKSSLNLSCQYNFVYITNIVLSNDEEAKKRILLAISTAHVVISQNVSSVEWLHNDRIAEHIPKYCRFIRLCFWRFYGYWPIASQKFHPQMWYVCDEMTNATECRDYLQTVICSSDIRYNFEQQLEKFAFIERESDVKMLPFLMQHYQNHKLFTDEWHPTSFFFQKIANYISSELGYPDEIDLLPDEGVDNFRHRLVFEAVSSELGLTYDQNLFSFHKNVVDRKVIFDYFKFAERYYDRAILWNDPGGSFQEWCHAKNIDTVDYEISRHGSISECLSVFEQSESKHYRNNVMINSSASAGRSIDLRDFRKINIMDVKFSHNSFKPDASLSLFFSIDGENWKFLTKIYALDDRNACDSSLTLDFEGSIFARHVKLELHGAGNADFKGVRIYTRAISQ